jgi:hypothetical protein
VGAERTSISDCELSSRRRRTEAQCDRERAKIRETYGNNKQQASIRWEQELAALFYRSGWTQDELAKKEERRRTYIVYLLRFPSAIISPSSRWAAACISGRP